MAYIIRRWRLFAAIAVAFFAFLAYAIDFTSVDVSCDPPEKFSVSIGLTMGPYPIEVLYGAL